MTTFILGMLTMWIICGLIIILAEELNVSNEIKIIVVGGFFWYPLVMLIRWIDTINFKKEMKKRKNNQDLDFKS